MLFHIGVELTYTSPRIYASGISARAKNIRNIPRTRTQASRASTQDTSYTRRAAQPPSGRNRKVSATRVSTRREANPRSGTKRKISETPFSIRRGTQTRCEYSPTPPTTTLSARAKNIHSKNSTRRAAQMLSYPSKNEFYTRRAA